MAKASTDLAMLETARAAIESYHLLPAQGYVVVGVSGGPDSVCLLHLLKRLCSPAGPFPQISLHVAHLDHGMRGEASLADAKFVADLAGQWGIPCTVERADIPAQARAEHGSLEEAA